jgi:calcium-dependent protein kinase
MYSNNMDHHSIVNYIESFQDENLFYVVMELCEGVELFAMIENKIQLQGVFTESETAEIMKSLLMAINHCHSKNIAHRDIKPENIIVGSDGYIKLIDFGLSKTVHIKELKTIVGSPYYIAPEVLDENYSYECDIWSLGVILYIMLSGIIPFDGANAAEVFKKIRAGQYSFSHKEWSKVSDEAKSLICGMLEIDIVKRYTAKQ